MVSRKGSMEFSADGGRSAKRVIVHAKSVRHVEKISEASPAESQRQVSSEFHEAYLRVLVRKGSR